MIDAAANNKLFNTLFMSEEEADRFRCMIDQEGVDPVDTLHTHFPNYKMAFSALGKIVVLNLAKLESERENIRQQLQQLPLEFFVEAEGGKGGWSFLHACMDRSGNHWGEHPDVNVLLLLGQILGYVTLPIPFEMWNILPSGMPYYAIKCES